MEERAQFNGTEADGPKVQFYTLPDGKAVVSRTIAIPEPDEFGRKGRYLSHQLVVEVADAVRLAYLPFQLLSAKFFFSSLNEALNGGDRSSGNISPKRIDLPGERHLAENITRKWDPENLLRLAELAWSAAEFKKERRIVAFEGSLEAILEALELAFFTVSPSRRAMLSFDSAAFGCDWGKEWPFWGWGGSPGTVRKADIIINAERCMVSGHSEGKPQTPYERWMASCAIPRGLDVLTKTVGKVILLEQVFSGQAIQLETDLEELDKNLLNEFASSNRDAVVRLAATSLPGGLSSEMMGWVEEAVHTLPEQYLSAHITGTGTSFVNEILFQALLKHNQRPLSKSDLNVLQRSAAETRNIPFLALLQYRATSQPAWRSAAWRAYLEKFPEAAYRSLLQKVFTYNVPVVDFLIPGKLSTWIEIAGPVLRTGDLSEMLRCLEQFPDDWDANSLADLVPLLDEPDLYKLDRWSLSWRTKAHRFSQAIESRLGKSDTPNSKPWR